MILKKVVLIFLQFILISSSIAQEMDLALKERVESVLKVYREKVYLHIDRPGYFIGESIHFSVFCVDGFYHTPSKLSKVVYVEILDKDQVPKIQVKVKLNQYAVGEGIIDLPGTLISGNYELRAYTKWMKNFDPDLFFQEQLMIINPFMSNDNNLSKKNINVQFFPEDGNLVYGLKSKVAFRINNDGGLDKISGFILNQQNDTITNLKFSNSGLGSFYLKPLLDEKYRAIIVDGEGFKYETRLPDPLLKGFVINLTENDEAFSANVYSIENNQDDWIYLVITSHGSLVKIERVEINNKELIFKVSKDSLPRGISRITIFDKDFRAVSDRLILNRLTSRYTGVIETNKKKYGKRENVSLNFTVDSLREILNYSISVYKIDSLFDARTFNIFEYLNLASELAGNSHRVKTFNFLGQRDEFDNSVFLQSIAGFQTCSVLQNSELSYFPELNTHVLIGEVVDSLSGEQLSEVDVFFSAPELNKFLITRTDKKGRIFIELESHESTSIIFGTKEKNCIINLQNPFWIGKTSFNTSDFYLPLKYAEEIRSNSIYVQLNNLYNSREEANGTETEIVNFTQPDKTYNLDDYTRFPTTAEIFKEYVPEISIRKGKFGSKVMVQNPITNYVFEDQPLILINDVPVFNHEILLDLNPSIFKTMSVVTKKYYFAGLYFGGIINFSTYSNDFIDDELLHAPYKFKYTNLSIAEKFHDPKYESLSDYESRLPDTRRLLYWELNKSIQSEVKLDFYTSDIKGNYVIVINGLTASGDAIVSTATFEVE